MNVLLTYYEEIKKVFRNDVSAISHQDCKSVLEIIA